MKKPRPDGGVLQIGAKHKAYRMRRSELPARGAFFDSAAVHGFVIIGG
jgi:hypothetical protein